jgi:hypothetical protein
MKEESPKKDKSPLARADHALLHSRSLRRKPSSMCRSTTILVQHHLEAIYYCTSIVKVCFLKFQSSGDDADLSRACLLWPEPFPRAWTNEKFLLANIHASLPPLLRIVKTVPDFEGMCLVQPHVSSIAFAKENSFRDCNGWEIGQEIIY